MKKKLSDEDCYNQLLEGAGQVADQERQEIHDKLGITDAASLKEYACLAAATDLAGLLRKYIPELPALRILDHFGVLATVQAADAAAKGVPGAGWQPDTSQGAQVVPGEGAGNPTQGGDYMHVDKRQKLPANVKGNLITKAKSLLSLIVEVPDWSVLTDPKKSGLVPHACISWARSPRFKLDDKRENFAFTGRTELQRLIDSISSSRYPIINVVGTKEFGKSHILAAYVARQLAECYKNRQKPPVIFLAKCGDLMNTRADYLREAMAVAFAADETSLEQIAALPTEESLLRWLSSSTITFDLVVDQCNDIEEKGLPSESKVQTCNLVHELGQTAQRGGGKVVRGFSANNLIMRRFISKERSEYDHLCYGGLRTEEYNAWLEENKITDPQVQDNIAAITGQVPGYLNKYLQQRMLLEEPEALESVTHSLCREINSELEKVQDHASFEASAKLLLRGAYPTADGQSWDHCFFHADREDGTSSPVCSVALRCLAAKLEDLSLESGVLSGEFIASCLEERNPWVRAFRVEEIVIHSFSKRGFKLAGVDLTVTKRQRFTRVQNLVFPQMFAGVWHFIPPQGWRYIDSMIIHIVASNQIIRMYPQQTTLDSVSAHKHTRKFFEEDYKVWESIFPRGTRFEWNLTWVLTRTETRIRHHKKEHGRHVISGTVEYNEFFHAFEEVEDKLMNYRDDNEYDQDDLDAI